MWGGRRDRPCAAGAGRLTVCSEDRQRQNSSMVRGVARRSPRAWIELPTAAGLPHKRTRNENKGAPLPSGAGAGRQSGEDGMEERWESSITDR